MEGETAEDPTLFPATVGEKLRAALIDAMRAMLATPQGPLRDVLAAWALEHSVELA